MNWAIVNEYRNRYAYISNNDDDNDGFVMANGDPYEPTLDECREFFKNGRVDSKGEYCKEKSLMGSKLVKITNVIYVFEEINSENQISQIKL